MRHKRNKSELYRRIMELSKNNKQRLVVERIVECGDSSSINKMLENKAYWYNIANHSHYYDLDKLLNEGWIIVDTTVSTARCCSQSGYTQRQDHTILILEKNE